MTTAAASADPPKLTPSSSFVAVASANLAYDPELALARRPERRAMARRVHDQAVRSVVRARLPLLAVFGPALLVLIGVEWFYSSDAVGSAWDAVVLITGAITIALLTLQRGIFKDRDTRRVQHRLTLLGVGVLIVLGLAPWTMHRPLEPDALTLVALVLCATALAGVALLAPLKDLALAAAALPLSPALAGWSGNGAASNPPAYALGGLFAAALAALLALVLHRRWQTITRAVIELDERLRSVEAARDAALKADQEKSRFLAIASHDLRQPVHAIGLFAATLDRRLQGSPEEPLVRNLNRAIDGLDRSFNVMLDISRLDAGAIEPRFQQFPLRDLFRRLHMHFAGQAEQKGLGLRFSPGGKSVSSDPQLLERVLGNLVQNAIKYTDDGGIVVVARSTPDHINVEIWDTGVGIRAADLPKVFDEFYQVGQGQRVRAQGLGMGLAIVKRLVRLLGHELTVASRPGRGTMFRLSIALGGLPEIQDVTAAADTLPMPLLAPRTVLVIDDEEPIREGLSLLLQEWGYDAIAAGSIVEAQRAVRRLEVPPDLILSDLHLGDGPDGIAAIEMIRDECGCEIAAMLITGDTSHAEIRRATESGHPVLFKPVQPRKLYDALRGMGS